MHCELQLEASPKPKLWLKCDDLTKPRCDWIELCPYTKLTLLHFKVEVHRISSIYPTHDVLKLCLKCGYFLRTAQSTRRVGALVEVLVCAGENCFDGCQCQHGPAQVTLKLRKKLSKWLSPCASPTACLCLSLVVLRQKTMHNIILWHENKGKTSWQVKPWLKSCMKL